MAADGGVFAYGDATYVGSYANTSHAATQQIVGIAHTVSGQGYWLLGSDGGVFTYGDAAFFGSAGGKPLNQAVTGFSLR